MEYATLNNGVKMPMAGIGTFLLSLDADLNVRSLDLLRQRLAEWLSPD